MTSLSLSRQRSLQVLLALFLLYLSLLFCFEFPFMSQHGPTAAGGGAALTRVLPLHSNEESIQNSAPIRPSKRAHRLLTNSDPPLPSGRSSIVSTLAFEEFNTTLNPTDLHSSAGHAWELGRKLFDELQSAPSPTSTTLLVKNTEQICPGSVMLTGAELTEQGGLMVIPCGLTLGSHITLVGRPRSAHPDYSPKITELKKGNSLVMVSQFMMELQGINAVDGEAPPKILHFNPRLKGDWNGHPVIEQNTCYRMQWGKSLRCDGRRSKADEEAVDGLVKCEEWIRHDDGQSEDSNTKAWLNQLMGKKVSVDFQFPFVENKLFVLTLSTGLEGYHVTVDGRHVTSFPYHPGFALEDATGLVLNGDIEVQSIFAAALPASHPSVTLQRSLQLVPQLKVPSLPDGPVELFVGILSAANHFAERMAVRRSWMSLVRKSSNAVVARFFVALHRRKEVNEELKREAEFFGDIVIVPYMDSYDLVVLKTVAIAEFGVHTISAKYVMKCDDDTFVRVDSVLKELRKIPINLSFYVGNINFYHKPLRTGKWAVTFEEWPEEDYPPYANGPGYIISSDIAHFVVSEFEKRTIRLFKMEDVSMGMWVEQFNDTTPVEYLHSLKFCQFGCIDGYLTAHYQSPRQMMCLWEKLRAGKPQCCNMR